jgi:BTB/POZ domain-containing protein 9
MEKGLYSDIDIVINGDEENAIKSHKAILMARSEKFRAMVESKMREYRLNRVEISDPDITVAIYKLLMQWIYEGECDLTSSTIDEMLGMLKLTDEYLLPDLQKVCEDTIIDSMDGVSAL